MGDVDVMNCEAANADAAALSLPNFQRTAAIVNPMLYYGKRILSHLMLSCCSSARMWNEANYSLHRWELAGNGSLSISR